jgi:hypothetical protein
MKLDSFTNVKLPEMVLVLLFIVYIMFPIGTPNWMRPFFNSAIGMMALFAITISLFVYTNPILGIVYIFVAYELIRRSATAPNYMNTPSVENAGAVSSREPPVKAIPDHKPLEVVLPREPESPDSFAHHSLEEEIINVRAPVGHSDPLQFTASSFAPVAHSVKNASMY